MLIQGFTNWAFLVNKYNDPMFQDFSCFVASNKIHQFNAKYNYPINAMNLLHPSLDPIIFLSPHNLCDLHYDGKYIYIFFNTTENLCAHSCI